MAVELLLVRLLQAEDDLNRTCAGRHFAFGRNDDIGGIPGRPNVNMKYVVLVDVGDSLENMRGDVLRPDMVLRDTLLVATHLL